MSPSTSSYLAGMLALFVGQRILDGIDEWQLVATVLGAGALVAAAALRLRELRAAKDPGLRLGHRLALVLLLVGVGATVLYVGTTERFVTGLHLSDRAEERWLGITRSLWPVVWLLGTVPLLAVDHALRSSPVVVPTRRVQETLGHGLVFAMGLCLVFPLNFIATKRNERWDLAYFKTPTPGTATLALVEALEEPVTVRIFMPPSSEVAQELRAYFAQLEGPKVQVEILDQAASPRLSKALAVRDNGTVAITMGDVSALMDESEPEPEPTPGPEVDAPEPEKDEGPQPVTKRLRVDPELDKAKRVLKKLDAEVGKMLIELGQGERVAYFTTGHGELNWSQEKELLDASIRALRTRMQELGFSVKPLGLTEGLGEKVPDDASLVLVLGPRKPFYQAEVDALSTYLDAGGSLLLAREPTPMLEGTVVPSDPLDGLMTKLGVQMGEGILASERNVIPLARNRLDAFNLVTNGFTSHPTTRQVSDRSEQLVVVTPATGHLEEVPGQENSVTFVVRSLAYTWADLNADTRFDGDAGETKEARNLMAAIEGGGATRWRAVATADASMFADLGVGLSLGNQRLAEDSINWLIGAEALAGTTESEEDVKIEHTKEGQQWWFYLTVLVVPLSVVLLGAARLRWRRRSSSASVAATKPAPKPETPKPAAPKPEAPEPEAPESEAPEPEASESDDEDDDSTKGGAA
ncbi:Gldg family protein [Paraliomyxa miuraensis]|uniref:Gldg family protein n=1 Tax=Paraliomyxa miuraensis TaxID=376150 RepID=UPI00225639FE|nr:Gldg family protein [Paraliomyxa miuraensis]MCX4246977.1 GldG family protein [Paraliomyxa miuraensis]